MPAPKPRPATARELIAAAHPAHLEHGAAYQGTRQDGGRVYHCLCGESLVVAADVVRRVEGR